MSYFPVSGYVSPDDQELPCGCVIGFPGTVTGRKRAWYVSTCAECTRLWRAYDAARQEDNPVAWEWPQKQVTQQQSRDADLAIDVHYAIGLRKLGWVLKRDGECLPVGNGNERAWGVVPIPSDREGSPLDQLVRLKETA